jgi:hypothetical protein
LSQEDILDVSAEFIDQMILNIQDGHAAVLIGRSDHDLPWTLLTISIRKQIMRASANQENLWMVFQMSWIRSSTAVFLIPLLEKAMSLGVQVSFRGVYDAFNNERKSKHEGILRFYEEFSQNPRFEYCDELSHCKLYRDNYSVIAAGGNYTKTRAESGSGNGVILIKYKQSQTIPKRDEGTVFKGSLDDLASKLKEDFNTPDDKLHLQFEARYNFSLDEHASLDDSLDQLNLFSWQKNIVLTEQRCSYPRQLILACVSSGKTLAAVAVLMQRVALKPTEKQKFVWVTPSVDLINQTVEYFEKYCPTYQIMIHQEGYFHPKSETIENPKATVYFLTYASLVVKNRVTNWESERIFKDCSLCVMDEGEAVLESEVYSQFPFLFKGKIMAMTATLWEKNNHRFEVYPVVNFQQVLDEERVVPIQSVIFHYKAGEAIELLKKLVTEKLDGKYFLFANDKEDYDHVFSHLRSIKGWFVSKASSHETNGQNQEALESFRELKQNGILVLIQKFTHGISVNDLAGVIDLRISNSLSNVAQKAGRAVRKCGQKATGVYIHLVNKDQVKRSTIFLHSSDMEPFIICESVTEVCEGNLSISRLHPDNYKKMTHVEFFNGVHLGGIYIE